MWYHTVKRVTFLMFVSTSSGTVKLTVTGTNDPFFFFFLCIDIKMSNISNNFNLKSLTFPTVLYICNITIPVDQHFPILPRRHMFRSIFVYLTTLASRRYNAWHHLTTFSQPTHHAQPGINRRKPACHDNKHPLTAVEGGGTHQPKEASGCPHIT